MSCISPVACTRSSNITTFFSIILWRLLDHIRYWERIWNTIMSTWKKLPKHLYKHMCNHHKFWNHPQILPVSQQVTTVITSTQNNHWRFQRFKWFRKKVLAGWITWLRRTTIVVLSFYDKPMLDVKHKWLSGLSITYMFLVKIMAELDLIVHMWQLFCSIFGTHQQSTCSKTFRHFFVLNLKLSFYYEILKVVTLKCLHEVC